MTTIHAFIELLLVSAPFWIPAIWYQVDPFSLDRFCDWCERVTEKWEL